MNILFKMENLELLMLFIVVLTVNANSFLKRKEKDISKFGCLYKLSFLSS